MKFQGKKRAKLMREISPEREAFLIEFPRCWRCGSSWEMTVHEILRGTSRGAALPERCCWFAACWNCNGGQLNDLDIWPPARQMALKWIFDRESVESRVPWKPPDLPLEPANPEHVAGL